MPDLPEQQPIGRQPEYLKTHIATVPICEAGEEATEDNDRAGDYYFKKIVPGVGKVTVSLLKLPLNSEVADKVYVLNDSIPHLMLSTNAASEQGMLELHLEIEDADDQLKDGFPILQLTYAGQSFESVFSQDNKNPNRFFVGDFVNKARNNEWERLAVPKDSNLLGNVNLEFAVDREVKENL